MKDRRLLDAAWLAAAWMIPIVIFVALYLWANPNSSMIHALGVFAICAAIGWVVSYCLGGDL